MKKRMIPLLMALLFLLCLSVNVFAQEVPILTQSGSIEITMMMGNSPIPGGKLICTRVGYIDEKDGNYYFCRLDGESIADVSAPETAEDMVQFVQDYQKTHPIETEEKSIDQDGKVKFDGRETGLYLITQENPPSGYYAISPFLVSIPNNEDGKYVYDVTIRSKVELEKTPKPTTPSPSKPKDSKLPQTGQITWHILVLIAVGLLLMVIGVVLRSGKRKDHHEA